LKESGGGGSPQASRCTVVGGDGRCQQDSPTALAEGGDDGAAKMLSKGGDGHG